MDHFIDLLKESGTNKEPSCVSSFPLKLLVTNLGNEDYEVHEYSSSVDNIDEEIRDQVIFDLEYNGEPVLNIAEGQPTWVNLFVEGIYAEDDYHYGEINLNINVEVKDE